MYKRQGKLKKVAVGGGQPIALADVSTPRGGTWLEDDSIVFSPEFTAGLVRIAAGGGKPEVLTRPDVSRGERTHRWPEALPGGADVLFTVGLASVGSFTTSFGRTYGMSPTAYRAAHPPAADRARIPTCVLRSWERRRYSRFREDSAVQRG